MSGDAADGVLTLDASGDLDPDRDPAARMEIHDKELAGGAPSPDNR